MAAKHLFTNDLTASTYTVSTVPAGKEWSFSIVFCNRTSGYIRVRFAVSSSGTSTPADSEFYMYDIEVPPNNSIERSGHTAQAGRKIIYWAEKAGISVNGHGYED